MQSYVRFQTPIRCPQTGRPVGVFWAAGQVENAEELPDYYRDLLAEILQWFNQNLTVPRLPCQDVRAVFWFRSDAQELVSRLWDLIAVLREADIQVEKCWTDSPGKIVYRDEHQIAAIPQGARVLR